MPAAPLGAADPRTCAIGVADRVVWHFQQKCGVKPIDLV
jgi:hypothetical protein